MKVFGIGWAKTGTTTLGRCLEILGFNHQSQNLDLVMDLERGDLSRILELAKEKQSFEDWPWIILYKQLDEYFPHSRFILTQRDANRWIRSYNSMLRGQGAASDTLNRVRRILYGLPFPNVSDSDLIQRYEKHNADVLAFFRQRPEDLLVVNWEQGHGWKELCSFLNLAVPAEPFPHANRGTYESAR